MKLSNWRRPAGSRAFTNEYCVLMSRVAEALVETMRVRSRIAGPQPDDRAALFDGPSLRALHQQAPYALPAHRSIHDEAADDDERSGFYQFPHRRVQPSDRPAVDLGNQEAVIRTREDPREPHRDCRRGGIVAKLRHQLRDVVGIGRLRGPYSGEGSAFSHSSSSACRERRPSAGRAAPSLSCGFVAAASGASHPPRLSRAAHPTRQERGSGT